MITFFKRLWCVLLHHPDQMVPTDEPGWTARCRKCGELFIINE